MQYSVRMVVPLAVVMNVEADSPERASRSALGRTRGSGLFVLDDIDPRRLGAERVEYAEDLGPLVYEVTGGDGEISRFDGQHRPIPDETPAIGVYIVQGNLTERHPRLDNAVSEGYPFNEQGQFQFSVQASDIGDAIQNGLGLIAEWLGEIEPSKVRFTSVTFAGSFYLRPTLNPRLSAA